MLFFAFLKHVKKRKQYCTNNNLLGSELSKNEHWNTTHMNLIYFISFLPRNDLVVYEI